MKFRFIGKKTVEIGALGIVHPGDIWEVENEAYMPLFKREHLFEEVLEKAPKKEAEIIEEDE